MRQAIIAALAVLLPYTTSHAEINIVDSLEWMAVDARLIVQGKVTAYADIKGPGAVVYRDVAVEVAETLKGKAAGKTLTVRLRVVGKNVLAAKWKGSGHSFLFFLRKGRASDDRRLDGHWVLRERRQSVIDLDQPEKVYKADMTYATEAKDILQIARKYAGVKRPRPEVGAPNIFKPQAGYLRLEVEPSTPIFRSVFGGSTCYINVPVEDKHRALAIAKAKSRDAWERARGADMLRNFPGPETIKLLNKLLHDPGEAKSSQGPDRLVRIAYPVRPAAYDALRALGGEPAKPPFERQPTRKEIRAFRNDYWTDAVRRAIRDHKKTASVSVGEVLTPLSWTRMGGGAGLAIRCAGPPLVPREGQGGALTLYVLPSDWQGRNSHGSGEKLVGGKYTLPTKPDQKAHAVAARYLGFSSHRQFFCLAAGLPKRPDYLLLVQKYFGLKIANAYVASTGIRSIAHEVPVGAGRTFSADGWVRAHHMSGDPKAPRVWMEHRPVPQQEIVAIWRAAMDLDKELLRRKHDPKTRHYHQLVLTYRDGARIVIGWVRGERIGEPKLKKLLELLDKRGYGAW